MSDNQNTPKQQQPLTKAAMDPRCPLGLAELPCKFCPLAVQRLKALRHAGRELSEEEEDKLGGCKFAVNHQLANYCFFSLVDSFIPENRAFSDMEVAHFLNISIDTVKKIEKKAVQHLRDSEVFKEIIDIHGGDKIMDDAIDPIDAGQ